MSRDVINSMRPERMEVPPPVEPREERAALALDAPTFERLS
jgi:hypothetical protein